MSERNTALKARQPKDRQGKHIPNMVKTKKKHKTEKKEKKVTAKRKYSHEEREKKQKNRQVKQKGKRTPKNQNKNGDHVAPLTPRGPKLACTLLVSRAAAALRRR